jgi:hypothetical protein
MLPEKHFIPVEQAGLLWTWWRGDPLPVLAPLLDFSVVEAVNTRMAAQGFPILSARPTPPLFCEFSAPNSPPFSGGGRSPQREKDENWKALHGSILRLPYLA